MKNTEIIIGIIIVIGILVGAYYLLGQEEPEVYTGPAEKITLAGYAGEAGTLVYVAEDQGFFEKNGLDVTIKGYGSGKAAADALINGEADVSTSADNVFVSNGFDRADLRILGTVATFENKELVARKDKGITTTADLKGKRIGVTKKSGGEFQLGVFLTFNGITFQDVEIVDLKPPEMMESISDGDVDAVFIWDSNAYYIKEGLGDNAISWQGMGDFYFVLLTTEDWIEKNPAAAERFMKAIVEAEEYVKDNPDEAKGFVRTKFGYDAEYMDYSWPNQKFVVVLPQAMLILLEDQARWQIENNLTDATEVPNYLDHIYMDALHEVKPEAIGIIH